MAIALVTHCTVGTPGDSVVVSGACDTTGSTLIVVAVASLGAQPAPVVTDSKGNSWTSLTEQVTASTDVRTQLWYSIPTSVGSGHTFTATGDFNYAGINAVAFSGTHTSAPFDVQNGSKSNSATSLATGSVTPSQDGEVLVTGLGDDRTATYSIDLSFTIADFNASGGSIYGCQIAYLIETTAAAKNPTWSQNSTACHLAAAIATFKAAASGGGSTSHQLGTLGVGG